MNENVISRRLIHVNTKYSKSQPGTPSNYRVVKFGLKKPFFFDQMLRFVNGSNIMTHCNLESRTII